MNVGIATVAGHPNLNSTSTTAALVETLPGTQHVSRLVEEANAQGSHHHVE
jgi:hypothetical protein